MCRWAAYIGSPIFLEEIVSLPEHSLIEQSQSATKAKTAINGDGFGLAWYGNREEPALYRDIMPAWTDENLVSLTRQIKSPLFMAHVRAATSGTTMRENCHPFTHGRWSFMHNGQIGNFIQLRRALENLLDDHHYSLRLGQSDSELLFLLAVQFGLSIDPIEAFRKAMRAASDVIEASDIDADIRFTAALSDGDVIWGFRYSTDDRAPTLFMNEGAHGWSLVSEPYEDSSAIWRSIPAGSVVCLDGKGVTSTLFDEPTLKVA